MGKLKELLQINEQKFRETGHLFGRMELELKNKDPLRYELAHARLLSFLIAARAMSKNISSSVVTREQGELTYAIFTPDGHAVAFSTGLMVHIGVMGAFIRWMIENDYEEDPGFHEGDLFSCNDMTIAGIHVPDIYTAMPIFYNEELVGWVCGLTHELDTGGVIPGSGMSNLITERFQEGVRISAEKVGANYKFFRYYEERIRRSTRVPSYWLMDDYARLAGNTYICQEVKKFIDEFGLDYYKAVTETLIEEGRLHHKARVKEKCIPGRYRAPHFYESLLKGKPVLLRQSNRDYLWHMPFDLTVSPEGKLIINLEGASPESKTNYNARWLIVRGMLSIVLVQLLHFDGKANDGSLADVELITVPGTICDSVDPFAATGYAWGTIDAIGASFLKCMSRAFYCRGYIEEMLLPGGSTGGADIGGTNQYGQFFGGVNFELAASGSGARGVMDGIDSAWAIWNPEGDQGNVEIWEFLFPYIYLGRRVVPDSGGCGKYRGGVTFKSVWMIWNTKNFILSGIGNPSVFPQDMSMCGGYPFPVLGFEIARDTNIKERISSKLPLPHGGEDPRFSDLVELLSSGEILRDVDRACVVGGLKDYDIVTSPQTPGCGFGDPVDREPWRVIKDLENGFISQRSAETIYGIKVSFNEVTNTWQVDAKGTEELRRKIRQERLKRGMPVKDWWKIQRERVKAGNIPEEINQMYAECRSVSPSWWSGYFDKFWALEKETQG